MMKKKRFLYGLVFTTFFGFSQQNPQPFKGGEYLRYKMSYSGFLKAGTAVLELKEEELNGKKVYHSIGKGKTATVVGWFFKVEDLYESFFDVTNGVPYLFKRKINEGGYKKHRETRFDYQNKKAHVKDFLKQKDTSVTVGSVQDMISSFYYLRTQNTDHLQPGDALTLNMFFDDKSFPFKLKYMGNEILKTNFGKVKTMIFKPLVQAGRVFKENESVTIWVTADANRIPIKMKASLSVGSLQAELERYKGLANPFEIIFD